ncbi:hypothetical protein PHAVU_008G245400, partial [Phaseolus vulgaris]|uniref:NB-ARC domain-containing protein n=1 Tax=Phaseolus vulgaris TaxID=3885 RepID=V7B853_PHAVU|nr:hypothetical protein PHAVU_008G2454000g [Phaseolus vulgaris]ESW14009.1 hypothetical protein PHAVU_008G2454000g [Phaseolus vulgaris]
MEDFFFSIATKMVEYAIFPILNNLQYICCFHNFASDLPNAKEQLELTRESVNHRIRIATNKSEKVEPVVEKWLKDVEKVLNEVQLLEERILNVNKSYFRRQCQYSLAKEIARKTTKMIQLHRDSKFEPFSIITELPGMKYYSNDLTMFKSTKAAYNKLLEALKNKSVSMIGLVGLGGSGKTTLAKEVGKKAEGMKLFEKVVMATVSQPLNIKRIRDEIIDLLSLELKEESDIGRAQRLSERLRKEDYEIHLEDLFRFGKGFCKVGSFGEMENARREMHEAIGILKSCFLLMQAGTKENVKMHDLVRDVALWIAAKSGQAIFTRTGVGLEVLTNDEIMKDTKALALWNIRTYGSLNYKINCTTLEILILCYSGGMNVPDVCSESLEKLKTLIINLSWRGSRLLLPESLKSLKNLRTLCLRNHDLGDISFVERLQALEILDLHGSSFEEFPAGIVKLKKLKLLDLFECRLKKNIVDEVYEVVFVLGQLQKGLFT